MNHGSEQTIMDDGLITPFADSIRHVFDTLFQLPVAVGAPSPKEGNRSPFDVSGVIGLSGSVTGTVVLSMPSETASAVVALFTGERPEPESDAFADAVGEIVNIVCGHAKSLLDLRNVSISCPSVVLGRGHRIASGSGMPRVSIPCSTDRGDLVLEVAVRPAAPSAAA
jgi:chemotaxis protein CheX